MFKVASFTPLVKKAGLDEDSPGNFKPISNLNSISKLIERLFLSRLQPQILGSPHFDHLQSAYRLHHSTKTALLLSLNNIYQAADNSQPSLLVSLDLSAASRPLPSTLQAPNEFRHFRHCSLLGYILLIQPLTTCSYWSIIFSSFLLGLWGTQDPFCI